MKFRKITELAISRRVVVTKLSFVLVVSAACGAKNITPSESTEIPAAVTPAPTLSKERKIAWSAPAIKEIRLGTSTETDLLKLLGQPDRIRPSEEPTFKGDGEQEQELEFQNVLDFPVVVASIGKDSRIIKSLSIDFPRPLDLDEVRSSFGTDHYEVNSYESFCIENETRRRIRTPLEYPYFLVYPSAGTIVFINSQRRATYFALLYKCDTGGRTESYQD